MKNNCIICFKILSVPTRFKIFTYLRSLKKKKLAAIKDLVRIVKLSQPTVTFHVNQLVKSGILEKEKVGRNTYCMVRQMNNCSNCVLFK
ncbi:MAG: winged helix-turn-helix domain-containing protein [bacterium]|nr:winged helix-turn-helix domain-containing protein [bacterium]